MLPAQASLCSMHLITEWRKELELSHKLLLPGHSHQELKEHLVVGEGVKITPGARGEGSSAVPACLCTLACWRAWSTGWVPVFLFLSGVCCFSQQHCAWHCLQFFSTVVFV